MRASDLRTVPVAAALQPAIDDPVNVPEQRAKIDAIIDEHATAAQAEPRSWGKVGDLGKVCSDLIDLVAASRRFARHFHFPLQHAMISSPAEKRFAMDASSPPRPVVWIGSTSAASVP